METIYTYDVKLRVIPKNGKPFDVSAMMGGPTYDKAAMNAVMLFKQWYPECKVEVK